MDDKVTARVGEARVKALENLSQKTGKSISEIVREFIEQGLEQGGFPGPQPPQPAPGPQPQPEPQPQPGPQPAPQPAPLPPAPWPGPGPRPLHPLIAARLPQLQALEPKLVGRQAGASISWHWLGVAALGGIGAFCMGTFGAVPNGRLQGWGLFVAVVAIIWADSRSGRDFKGVILDRAITDLRNLIGLIPIEWDAASRTLPPDAAAAQVLTMIDERLKRLGTATVSDAAPDL